MRKLVIATLSLGALSPIAWAFPWDTDMADATYLRAYAWEMATLPEGIVSVNHARIPGGRYDAATSAMVIPEGSDLKDGQHMFDAYCVACHGVDGSGNEVLNGPPLRGQSDWYLVSSMQKYRAGQRGGDITKDSNGALMRTMAMTLPNEQAIKDVVAYIRTLGN